MENFILFVNSKIKHSVKDPGAFVSFPAHGTGRINPRLLNLTRVIWDEKHAR